VPLTGAAADRLRQSRVAVAVDILATAPVVSANSLVSALRVAVQNASALLDGFVLQGIVIEVSHHSKRRL